MKTILNNMLAIVYYRRQNCANFMNTPGTILYEAVEAEPLVLWWARRLSLSDASNRDI
jgi:hypothetical protein